MKTGEVYKKRIIDEVLRRKLAGVVDTSRQEPVAFKMVVTATGDCAYRRTD